jgi:hypothetical protein
MTNFEELNNNFDLNKFKEFKPNAKDLTFTFKEKILFNNVYMQGNSLILFRLNLT